MKLDRNTILITGALSGIERALTAVFHERGNCVIVTGRLRNLLDEISKARRGFVGMRLDLDELTCLPRLGNDVRVRFPELNVLIANAGISRLEDMASDTGDISDAEAIVRSNILGVLMLTAEFLPVLRKQSNATKASLHSWFVSVRHQLHNVSVLEPVTPYVQTELTGTGQAPNPRPMPLDVFIADVMRLIDRRHQSGGEILLERDHARRWAERDGTYADIFAAMKPK